MCKWKPSTWQFWIMASWEWPLPLQERGDVQRQSPNQSTLLCVLGAGRAVERCRSICGPQTRKSGALAWLTPLLPSDCASCSCLSGQGPGATWLLSDNTVTSCSCRVSYFFKIYSQWICMSEPLCSLPETVTTLLIGYAPIKKKDMFTLTS